MPRVLARAADAHQQDGLRQGVVLIVGVLADDLETVLDELLRPVAGLAGLARGAQVADGCGNGPRVLIQDHGEDLAQAGELALHEPGRSGTDVAGDAFHARVGRVLVGGVLGLHHGVAGLAAKGDAVHVGDRAVGELAADGHVHDGGDPDEPDQPANLRRAQSEGIVGEWVAAGLALRADVHPDAERDESQSQEEDAGQDQKSQDPDIGMLHLAAHAGRKQEEPQNGSGGHQDHAHPADQVLAQVDQRVHPGTQAHRFYCG